MVDRYQQAALATPLAHPADLRHRHRARRRQHVRRHRLPAQHRPGRHPRPGPGARRRARRRLGDPGDRAAVGLRAVHLRGARRPLGPHLRVVRRDAGAGGARWRPPSTASRDRPDTCPTTTACWPPPSTSPATALTTYGTGSNRSRPATTRSTRASTRSTAQTFDRWRSRRTSTAVQEHHVGSVMPSYSDVDWTEDGLGNRVNMHAQRRPDHRLAQGPAGLRRLRDLRLQRHRPHQPGRLRRSRSRSRPA